MHLILAEGRPGEKYNVGGRNERTNLAVVETICDMLDRLVPAGRAAAPPHHLRAGSARPRPPLRHRRRTSSSASIGWRAEHDFDSGLAKTVRWYLDNRAWWEPLRKGVYSGERLGLIKAAE